MIRKYVAIGNWIDRETGTKKSNLAELSEGTNKKGDRYQIADTARTMIIENETHPVGTILSFAMTRTSTDQEVPDGKINLKKG